MMRKLLYILILTLAYPLLSQAQIKVWDKQAIRDNQSNDVVVKIKVEAQGIDGTTALDIVIRDNDGNQQLLPTIIYASTADRYWQVVRSAETPWIFRTKNQPITTEYSAKVPYQEWMNHASVAVNQVRFEKCGEWLVDTLTVVQDAMLVPYPKPKAPVHYLRLIGFIEPEVEGVKRRAAMVQLNINYPVNVYKVVPSYMNNPSELAKVDEMMNVALKNDLITVNSYNITGYASPEGTHASNTILSRNRANGFRTYIMDRYSIGNRPITTEWVPEDWEGLAKAVNESDIPFKNEIQIIINSTPNPDSRDAVLRALDGGQTYSELLKYFYPPLRRIELRADYTVSTLTDAQAKDLIYKRPELLSLDEMYRVALVYKPGTQEYREVYEIAARYFPKDVIANNNAAAAALLMSDTKAAKVYLDKIKDDKRSYINRGVIAYIDGDKATALKYFEIAAKAGYAAGITNTKLLQESQK